MASPRADRSTSSTPLASRNVKDLRQNPGYSNVDIFTYEEMRLATKRFRPDLILGEGGFGVVYKGVIDENVRPGYKTTQVAIKELNREGYQGDREWLVFHSSFLPIKDSHGINWTTQVAVFKPYFSDVLFSNAYLQALVT